MLCRGATTLFTWVPVSASTHTTRRAVPGPRDESEYVKISASAV